MKRNRGGNLDFCQQVSVIMVGKCAMEQEAQGRRGERVGHGRLPVKMFDGIVNGGEEVVANEGWFPLRHRSAREPPSSSYDLAPLLPGRGSVELFTDRGSPDQHVRIPANRLS